MRNGLAGPFQESSKEVLPSAIEFLPLVKSLAYRLLARMPQKLEAQDLINAGIVGLLQAIRDYDPSRNSRLETYAYVRIRGAMLDAMRQQDWVPRSFRDRYKRYVQTIQQLAKRLGRQPDDDEISGALDLSRQEYEAFLERARPLSFLSLDDLPLSKQGQEGLSKSSLSSRLSDPGECAELREVRNVLGRAIDALPERERRVVQLYYYEELNLKEIGKVLGVGESRVCQIHTQALMRLKALLNELGFGK